MMMMMMMVLRVGLHISLNKNIAGKKKMIHEGWVHLMEIIKREDPALCPKFVQNSEEVPHEYKAVCE